MLKLFITQFLVIALIILAVLGLIYGSILPFLKAKMCVRAMGNLQSIKSLDEFKKNFNAALDFYSPVGQEETARFLTVKIVERMIYSGQQEAVSRELVNYIEPRVFYNRSGYLLLMASAYVKMFNIYGNENDLKKSEEYFQKSLILNPKSPQALYSLFDIYQQTGRNREAKETGETILKYWPEDERVKRY